MPDNTDADFNEILEDMIHAAIKSQAVSSSLILHDSGYQLEISLTRLEDEE